MNIRKTQFSKLRSVRTGVLIFTFTVFGSLTSFLTGWFIAANPQEIPPQVIDGITAGSEMAIAIGSITLVWFFLWEGAQMTKTMRSSAYSAINERFQDLSKAMMENCESRDWYADPPGDDQQLARDSRAYLCDIAFTLFEEVYYHRIEFELLDDENWESWRRSIKSFVVRPYVTKYWQMVRSQYSDSFSETIDRILVEKTA